MLNAILRCGNKENYDKVIAFLIKLPKKKLVEFVVSGENSVSFYSKEFDVEYYIKKIKIELDRAKLQELEQLISENLDLSERYLKEKNYTKYHEKDLEWIKLNRKYNTVHNRFSKNINIEGDPEGESS